MIEQAMFAVCLFVGIFFFIRQLQQIGRNIHLGRPVPMNDRKNERWATMFKTALGQGKMFNRPLAAVLHLFIYVGFVLINVEVLEIFIDGLAGTHRFFYDGLGMFYNMAIAFFEVLAFLVLASCIIFLLRRFVFKVKRFSGIEMKAFPVRDAATILVVEIVLMSALLIMNAADQQLQVLKNVHYVFQEDGVILNKGIFPISSFIVPLLSGMDENILLVIERGAWWFHFIGILLFMNYLPMSKHFHIIMAFPNTYYSRLEPKGQFPNMPSVTQEVKLMMNPNAAVPDGYQPPTRFGVKDVQDLTWKNLMDAYTCTECGRCTSVCPANLTGKLLSPRKIMMDTRDRLEEVGKNIKQNGEFKEDEKNLHSYITEEELWACTTCNACVQECPVNISPVEIIIEMRRYLVLEKSSAPQELNLMFTNLENNGAPWQMAQTAKFEWASENSKS